MAGKMAADCQIHHRNQPFTRCHHYQFAAIYISLLLFTFSVYYVVLHLPHLDTDFSNLNQLSPSELSLAWKLTRYGAR